VEKDAKKATFDWTNQRQPVDAFMAREQRRLMRNNMVDDNNQKQAKMRKTEENNDDDDEDKNGNVCPITMT